MPLPADVLTVLRQWIGDEPDDATLETLYTDVYKNYDQVVLHVLNNRLAQLSLEPSSVTVPGLSVSHGNDLNALQLLIKNFRSQGTGLEKSGLNYGLSVQSIKRNYPR